MIYIVAETKYIGSRVIFIQKKENDVQLDPATWNILYKGKDITKALELKYND